MKIKKIFNKELKYELIVLAAFLVLTAFMTYPLIFRLDSIFFIDADSTWYTWNFWLWNKSIVELHESPFRTDFIYYPQTISLSQSEPSPLNSFISIPLQHLFGLNASLNLLLLFSFVLAGFGAYLLVYYLTENRIAGFVAGIIFAFAPTHFVQVLAGQIATASIQWIPLFVLYLIKTFKEKNYRNAVFVALFFALTTYSSWYLSMFLVYFTLFFFAYNYFYERNKLLDKDLIKRSALMVGVSAFIVLPLFLPLIPEIIDSLNFKNYLFTSDHFIHSSDLAEFFIPSGYPPFFGNTSSNFYKKFFGEEIVLSVFIGFTVLSLSIASLFKVDRKKTLFWAFAALLFFVLSLGPVLQVFGNLSILGSKPIYYKNFVQSLYDGESSISYNREVLKQPGVIPLPYAFLEEFPFTALLRAVHRFALMLMLCLSVLAGFFCARLLKDERKMFGIAKGKLFVFLICVFILFEFLVIQLPIQSSIVPEKFLEPSFFKEIGSDKENYALIELPYSTIYGSRFSNILNRRYNYYQTIHGKKIVGGFADRLPVEQVNYSKKLPFVRLLLYPELINEENINESPEILKELKIKYIVIHDKIYIPYRNKYIDLNKLIMPEDVSKLGKILEKNFPKSNWKQYPEEHITVIKVY
ncbi:MAG: hypothetical protein AB1467_01890 [Candidatus Diapherotrites archaeon]